MSENHKISHNSLSLLRSLTARYFDGATSPEENLILEEAAQALSEGSIDLSKDKTLAIDLKTIKAIRDASIKDQMADMHTGLEQRLDRHVTRLARKSRWAADIRRTTQAAAVVAMIAIGTTLMLKTDEIPADLQATAEIESPSISTSLPELTPEAIADNVEINHSESSESNSKAMPIMKKATPITKESRDKEPQKQTEAHSLKLTAKLPDLSPTLASIEVNPADILTQPLSTLGQSIDNVMESINFVSRMFADINSTVVCVSRETTFIASASINLEN